MRLTDKQKKQIQIEYEECGVYSQVARKHHVHPSTVKRLVSHSKEETVQECGRKSGTREIARYMEERKDMVCDLIGIYLDELMSKDRLKKAPINQIASAMGTVIDKFIKHEDIQQEDKGGVVILPDVIKQDE